MNQRGFTVIELLAVTALVVLAGSLFWIQKNNIQIAARDEKRKIAINAMYYSLEESFYPSNKYYPSELTDKNLTTLDPSLFTDPQGVKLGQTTITVDNEEFSVQSDYRYEPTGCNGGEKCTGYTLRADLEGEADYVKTSRR